MKRLYVLRRVPVEPRDLIRQWEGIREDQMLNPGADERNIECAHRNIRGLLSLIFRGKDLDKAVSALKKGAFSLSSTPLVRP